MLKKSFAALLAASVVSWPLAAAAATEVKKPAATSSKSATKSATKPAAKSTTKSAAKPAAPQETPEIELAHGLPGNAQCGQVVASLHERFRNCGSHRCIVACLRWGAGHTRARPRQRGDGGGLPSP